MELQKSRNISLNHVWEILGIIKNQFITSKFYKLVSCLYRFFLKSLLVIIPLFLGFLFDNIAQNIESWEYFKENYKVIVRNWKFITFFTVLIFYGFIYYIYLKVKNLTKQIDNINFALRWVYEDLELNKFDDQDIRCTLWSPIDSEVPVHKMKLKQVADYIPSYSKLDGKGYYYNNNKRSGRIRKVARLEKNGRIRAIGLIGKCVVSSKADRKAYKLHATVDENRDFIDQMVNTYNFLPFEAKLLTQNRKSYFAIALMDAGLSDIIGVLFFDSKVPTAFPPLNKGEMQIERYLPRLATLLIHPNNKEIKLQ